MRRKEAIKGTKPTLRGSLLLDELRGTNQREGRDLKICVLYKAMKMLQLPLKTVRTYGLEVRVQNNRWVFFSIITSYCCDILERKDMFGIKHEGRTSPCVGCHSTYNDIEVFVKGDER